MPLTAKHWQRKGQGMGEGSLVKKRTIYVLFIRNLGGIIDLSVLPASLIGFLRLKLHAELLHHT